jgi:hypothetical protein
MKGCGTHFRMIRLAAEGKIEAHDVMAQRGLIRKNEVGSLA